MTDRIATLRPMPRPMASVLSKVLAMAASLTAATTVPVAPLQAFDKASYNPAILSLSFTQEASGIRLNQPRSRVMRTQPFST